MYKTDNNQIVITHEELETIIKKAFLKGENWGVTYSTWFIPSKAQQKDEIKKVVNKLLPHN